MKTIDVIKHFNNSSQAVANALGISPSAVSQWGESPPRGRQFELEKLTNGALQVDEAPPRAAA